MSVLLFLPLGAGAALTKDQQKCIDGMNNKGRLVSKMENKEIRKCVKNSGKGKESSAETCLTADVKGKVAKKQSKVEDIFAKKCTGSEPIQQGVTATNFAHVQGPLDLAHDLFGDPIDQLTVTPSEKEAQKCQDKTIQRAGKLFDTKILEFRKCKKFGMKDGLISTSAELRTQCMTPSIPDLKGKIDKKRVKLEEDVAKHCSAVEGDLATLFPGLPAGTCAASVADVATCVEERVECRVCQTLNTADGMDRDCDEFDNGVLDDSCAGGFTQQTCVLAGGGASKIQLFAEAGGDTPLSLDISGAIDLATVPPQPITGLGVARCDVQVIDPINITAIGVVCIQPAGDCPIGERDCDGGGSLGVDVLADGAIGPCVSNADCIASCDTYCNALGVSYNQASSGCTGYCTEGTMQACDTDADCSGGNGTCNGPEGVRTGGNSEICQCVCRDRAAFGASPAGSFQCNLGADLNVESAAPCGDGDVTIAVGQTCIPISTQRADVRITNTNFNACGMPPCLVPPSGPASVTGVPIDCATFDGGATSGFKGVGGTSFFGSALGDLAVTFEATCQ